MPYCENTSFSNTNLSVRMISERLQKRVRGVMQRATEKYRICSEENPLVRSKASNIMWQQTVWDCRRKRLIFSECRKNRHLPSKEILWKTPSDGQVWKFIQAHPPGVGTAVLLAAAPGELQFKCSLFEWNVSLNPTVTFLVDKLWIPIQTK